MEEDAYASACRELLTQLEALSTLKTRLRMCPETRPQPVLCPPAVKKPLDEIFLLRYTSMRSIKKRSECTKQSFSICLID